MTIEQAASTLDSLGYTKGRDGRWRLKYCPTKGFRVTITVAVRATAPRERGLGRPPKPWPEGQAFIDIGVRGSRIDTKEDADAATAMIGKALRELDAAGVRWSRLSKPA